jgi:hypothetical protein
VTGPYGILYRIGLQLVKAKKCMFGLSSIEYVGKVISSDGLSMSKVKIVSVLNFPRPKDNTSLRALLGLANYFRGFVPKHSTIVASLNRMVDQKGSKRSSVSWTDDIRNIRKTKILKSSNVLIPLKFHPEDLRIFRILETKNVIPTLAREDFLNVDI